MRALNLPSGTVTFLLTDIEGSTELWERHPDQTRTALVRHDQIIETLVEQHSGHMVRPRGEGDSRFAVFERASDAVAAAAAIQEALFAEPWPTPTALRVRMALHTGEADWREGDYYGTVVNRCARLRAAAHGGQTLLSRTTHDLVRDTLPPTLRLRDLGQHRLPDLQQPEHVFQLVLPHQPSEFPPLRTLDTRPNNLPLQRSPIVGRESERAEVRRLLFRDDVACVTLTGPGGIGKTRLALQVAADLVDEFADGTFFVSLAPIREPALVASAIAKPLSIQSTGGRQIDDALADYLSEMQLLLLLDNFEQVIEAAPLVAKLVSAAPRLRVLVTSREALRLRDEQEFPVPPLRMPNSDRPGDTGPHLVSDVSQYDAVALFVQRAHLVQSRFELTAENAAAVAEICHRLDGLPLAIELAAARLRSLTPQALLSRLSSRLRLLTSGPRDLPERQQTLRSTIQWSYDLLEPNDQRLFRRMSVFSGGSSLEAIEAVCNVDAALKVDVLDGIASLVDKNLVRQDIGTGNKLKGGISPFDGGELVAERTQRYVMLETIREFALELLQTVMPGENELLFRQHAEYYLGLAEQGWLLTEGPQYEQWLDQLEVEYGNLQEVLQRVMEQRDGVLALRLVAALWTFWLMHGYVGEGNNRLREALALPGAETPNRTRAVALWGAATGGLYHGDVAVAQRYAQESVAIFRQLAPEEQRGLGNALVEYGAVTAYLGAVEDGRAAMEEGIVLLRRLGNKWDLAEALLTNGIAVNSLGDYEAAGAAFEECLTLARALGSQWFLANALNSLGDLSRVQGNFNRAKELYEESLSLYRQVKSRSDIPASLHNLGNVALAQGEVEEAERRFAEALHLHLQQKNRLGVAECLTGLAGVAGAKKQPERSARLYGAAEALYDMLGVSGHVWPAERADYERNVAHSRAQLDEAAWQTEFILGKEMTMQEAVIYAIEQDVIRGSHKTS